MVMEDGHGQDKTLIDALLDQLHDLETGHGSQSWTEGKRYNAQCDGKNHYLYKMDKAAINPKTGHGYSKGRIYAGTFENAREKCPAYAANWTSRHNCRKGGISDGHGRPESHGTGRDEGIKGGNPVRWQDLLSASN